MRLGSFLLDLIYPSGNICLFCDQNLFFPEISGLCCDCLQKIYFVENYCPICGRKIDNTDLNKCNFCNDKDWNFKQARGIAEYKGLMKELILHFKYFNKTELIAPLGDILSNYFKYYYGNREINYIIPVPLHEKRKEIRGYNQARILADSLQKNTGIPVLNNYVVRKKNSPPLYNLNWEQRKKALTGVFDIARDVIDLTDMNIVVIDDIFTSGATVNEVSSILNNKAGVNDIYILTLATSSTRSTIAG